MKKVLKAVILSAMVLSLSLLAAGQAAPGSLDDQLIQAARIGDTAAVQQLLQKGASIEAKYGPSTGKLEGFTALHMAATSGSTDVVKLLLGKGANVQAKDDLGFTVLHMAACSHKRNAAEVVELLLDKGANIEAKDRQGFTALLYAARTGNSEVVKLLLDKGADVEARDAWGKTPLINAANNAKAVDLLLGEGADINDKDNDGDTALIEAAQYGNVDVVKLLLEKGANVEARDNQGRTALAVATSRGGPEVVRLLEQHGSQNPLAPYLIALQNAPYDEALRHKILKASTGLPTPPAIPEEARQLFLQASALIKQTSTPAELQKPIELLRKALVIAPWWGNAYYNLSRALELSGKYDEAVKQLNYYLELKPTEADASEARAHIAVIQSEKESAAHKKQESEYLLAVKYVSGGVTRLRSSEAPAWWSGKLGIDALYTYWVREEDPFYANVFRMPNGRYLAITLNAQSNNGVYAGDKVSVIDITDKSCAQGRDFAFGELHYTEPCGAHYDVNVSNQPNATATVTYPATGASVTLPIALLYRGRALKPGWDSTGTAYEGGSAIKVLHFERSVVNAAEDPNVNAMGLTPTTVTPYQPDKK
ncbi:MAG: ankyrin repeat domain-containing protein [Candidatus Korobacteraceae bacterium]